MSAEAISIDAELAPVTWHEKKRAEINLAFNVPVALKANQFPVSAQAHTPRRKRGINRAVAEIISYPKEHETKPYGITDVIGWLIITGFGTYYVYQWLTYLFPQH